jgi:hypothetical protein
MNVAGWPAEGGGRLGVTWSTKQCSSLYDEDKRYPAIRASPTLAGTGSESHQMAESAALSARYMSGT